MTSASYTGRFAPSPTGPLHAGSLVAALASWLDARAHGGRWLVRIEDIDPPRCQPGAAAEILRQLACCGLLADEPAVHQSRRHALYEKALQQLQAQGLAYACGCTRKELEAAWQAMGLDHERHLERPYPGTCRSGLHGKHPRAWRFALCAMLEKNTSKRPEAPTHQALAATNTEANLCGHALPWHDRRLGSQSQDVARCVGDFVLRRADGLWAYQMAVVVDDGQQGITHVVRGEDLADNTPRQMLLQQALGLSTPAYLHTPLVRMADGEKLSKQHGAAALDLGDPLATLCQAAAELGLPAAAADSNLSQALHFWVQCWRHAWPTYN
ncbi:tRNA glutamyl-Q(34) synthetase GluQRS [Comamonas composti]|uniref:tRNA glutamyl-Q(34) synthetase GluQRS n=1 Tax=Comamonas composti TaxID=408558 RepID=UPI000555D870|nr:tRNA glutamyl-Q(34) synthetase GluQRS [Comamonas composti]